MAVAFYTPCYVEVRNSTLSTVWLVGGAAMVAINLLLVLCQYDFTQHHTPAIDVLFWQDSAVDGSWWPVQPNDAAPYCGMSFVTSYDDGSQWGSTNISCSRPGPQTRARLFYPASNEIGVAFSIAYGDAERDPQYNTSIVQLYEGIEFSTIAFHPSLSTAFEAREHVPNCQALTGSGMPVGNRYESIYPSRPYGEGVLLLSVEDVVRATGRELDDIGADGATLRLGGLEMVAHVDIRNFAVPFRWPFAWNPLALTPASQLDCTVRFYALREHFTPVHWFYEREEPIALQHGLRLRVTTTGSVGYFSWPALLTNILLAFTAFTVAQSLLDTAWYYLHPDSKRIASKAFHALDIRLPSATSAANAANASAPAMMEEMPPATSVTQASQLSSDQRASRSLSQQRRGRRSPSRLRRGAKED